MPARRSAAGAHGGDAALRPWSTLLLHGAGGGGWEWNVWRGVLESGGIEVHAPDLAPAAGGPIHTALDDYVGQAARALLALPRPRALVGASLGGLLAAMCAGEADAVVLVNPLPPAPWHGQLPQRDWPELVPWRRDARLEGTRSALPDADEASALYAFARWRDESGRVLRTAHAGVAVPRPSCPVLCLASACDAEVPPAATAALAGAWDADLLRLPATSHAGALLGRAAADAAAQVRDWLRSRRAAGAGMDAG